MSKKKNQKNSSCDGFLKVMMGAKCVEGFFSALVSIVVIAVIIFFAVNYNSGFGNATTTSQTDSSSGFEYADKADSRFNFYLKEKEIERAGEFESTALPYMVEIEVLHVGQGGCVVLRDGSICTLIDVGGPEDGALIGAHLNDLGVSAVDVVLTTTDNRHCGGLNSLAEWVEIQKVYTTSKIANEISLSGYAIEEISQCTRWRTGSYSFCCLASSEVAVIRATVGNHSLVYLSNLTAEYETEVSDARFAGMDITAEFLVAASHAEIDTNSEWLLSAIGASQNFIQMDENEVDPYLKTVNRLHKFATTWRTDRFDTCVIHTDGVDYTMRQDANRNCNGK